MSFSIFVGDNWQIYQVESGDFYTTETDEVGSHKSFGYGNTIDQIIADEKGTKGKCEEQI